MAFTVYPLSRFDAVVVVQMRPKRVRDLGPEARGGEGEEGIWAFAWCRQFFCAEYIINNLARMQDF